MPVPKHILTSRLITLFTLFALSINPQLRAQEFTISANTQYYGMIDGAFVGPSLGVIVAISNRFTVDLELDYARASKSQSTVFELSFPYYFRGLQSGFYFGPQIKRIAINRQLDAGFEGNLFAIGFSIGYKLPVSQSLAIRIGLSPHKTVGGTNEADVAGISGQFGLGWRF